MERLCIRTYELLYHLFILLLIVSFMGCGDGKSSGKRESTNQSAAISFQLTFAQSQNRQALSQIDHAISEPDICTDYAIDTMAVSVYQTQDNTEVASAKGACADHSLTVKNVPAGQSLYVVCKGLVGSNTAWQGRRDGIVAVSNQNTDIGIIDMQYAGDDNTGPEISATFPAADTIYVDLNASIVAVFNEPLAPSTIPDQAIIVKNNDTPVPGEVGYDPDTYTIRFTPVNENGLDPETTYTAMLQSHDDADDPITDTAGNQFDDDITWQFTTRGESDFTHPQVIATTPANFAANVDQQASISVVFSEAMDPESFTDSVFQLSSDEGSVNGQIAYDDQARKLTMMPGSGLNDATMYTAVISTEAKDLAQNAINEHFVWQFCTIGSYIISTSVVPKSGTGGYMIPDIAHVIQGDNQRFDIEINPHYSLLELIVDGVSITPEPSYTFYDVSKNHLIQAKFRCDWLLSENPVQKLSYPQSKGGRAVWHGQGKSKTDIYYYHYDNVQEKYIVENITDSWSGNHRDPQINSNGHIVWSCYRDGKADIYYYGGTSIQNITEEENLPGDQRKPQINDSGHVAWYGGDNNIYYYDRSDVINLSGQSTNNTIASQKDVNDSSNLMACVPNPQINNNGDVVWATCDYDLYYYNSSTGNVAPIPDTPNLNFGHQINDNGDVVWSGRQANGLPSSIYFYDNETKTADIISDSSIIFNGSPQIDDAGHVVWSGGDTSGKYDIYYYNGASAENFTESIDGNHYSPQLNNSGYMAWKRTHESKSDIYYYDKKRDMKVNVTNSLIGTFRAPQLVGNKRIIWQGHNGDDYGIYLRYVSDFNF